MSGKLTSRRYKGSHHFGGLLSPANSELLQEAIMIAISGWSLCDKLKVLRDRWRLLGGCGVLFG
jgi:hypothetical protein